MMKKEDGHMCGPGGCGDKGGCKCMHHKVPGVLVVLFGLSFLLKGLGYLTMEQVNIEWPILVIILGLMKLMGGKCKCCKGC